MFAQSRRPTNIRAISVLEPSLRKRSASKSCAPPCVNVCSGGCPRTYCCPIPRVREINGMSVKDTLPRASGRSDAGFAGRPAISLAFLTARSEEHTSELQSLMRNSDAVFCLKKKNHTELRVTQTFKIYIK